MAMQELNMQEVEQISGGDFSPSAATYGVGAATAAGVGAMAFGPVGAVVGFVGFSGGFAVGMAINAAARLVMK